MPMTYSPEERESIKARVLGGLAKGTPLAVLCREEKMPCDNTVREWAESDPAFAAAIVRARDDGFDAIALEGLRIVDDITEDPASRRVRADYRLRLLAKWDPKRYGDKVDLAHSGGVTVTMGSLDDRL